MKKSLLVTLLMFLCISCVPTSKNWVKIESLGADAFGKASTSGLLVQVEGEPEGVSIIYNDNKSSVSYKVK
jgi:uncharacterized protein YcfL